MTKKAVKFLSSQTLDWTWLLTIPVPNGEPVPLKRHLEAARVSGSLSAGGST